MFTEAEKDFFLAVVPIAAKEDMRVWVVFDEVCVSVMLCCVLVFLLPPQVD
jgi:hypothetical protein